MTTFELNEINRLKATLPEIKENLQILQGGVIASINVRKFDHQKCDYEDVKVSFQIPRGILKDAYIKILQDKLEYNQNKIHKLMNPEEYLDTNNDVKE